MAFALFGVISIAACWKWSDWRNWRLYYPTVLYLLVGDLTADFLLYGKPLFSFGEFIEKYPVLDLTTMVLIYPATVLLYLSHLPKTTVKLVLYILMWAVIYMVMEFIAQFTGGYCHHNGWNIWYSLGFDLLMFPLLALHFKKPLLVWPISAVLCFLLLWWFRIPFLRQ